MHTYLAVCGEVIRTPCGGGPTLVRPAKMDGRGWSIGLEKAQEARLQRWANLGEVQQYTLWTLVSVFLHTPIAFLVLQDNQKTFQASQNAVKGRPALTSTGWHGLVGGSLQISLRGWSTSYGLLVQKTHRPAPLVAR